MRCPLKRIAPPSRVSTPVRQLNSVVLPEPFGPMSPWILPGASARETRFTAATPPKRLTRCSTSRIGTVAISDRPRQVVLLLEDAEDPARHHEHHGDDDGAEQELVKVDEPGPDHLLNAEEQHGAEDRAPDGALAAEQRHDDHGDGREQGKDADGLDVALVPRGEAAGNPRPNGREQE